MIRLSKLALAVSLVALPACAQGPTKVADFLSLPFMNQLAAAPAKNRVAWFVDDKGVRNVWVASPTEKAHAVTHYTDDDGQDIDNITWSPDGEWVAYTRGTGPDGSEHPAAANPAHLQDDVKQRVEIASVGGEMRVIGEGHAPVFSTDGKRLFFLLHGKVMADDLGAHDAPVQLVQAHGTASGLRPSPDGTKLAFVSKRDDHSFIGVFDLSTKQLIYVDPGTGLDHDAAWSADSKRIAFIRESPVLTDLDLRWMREVPVPWSIRIADVASGDGKQVWQADKGAGSLFHEMTAKNQLLWMNDGRIVFPWEKTGWLQLYSLVQDGSAKALTTGAFEIDNVVSDGKRIVYSNNQVVNDPEDIDRRHLWSVSGTASPVRVTSGITVETNPALFSDGSIAAMLGSIYRTLGPVMLSVGDQCKVGPGKSYHPDYMNAATDTRCGHNESLLPEALRLRIFRPDFVPPQMVVFPASDGLQIHAQWFLPKDAKLGEKLPTIVFFHGGSRRQMLLGFNPMQYYAQAYEFDQYLVSRGYAVLSVNYRSGTGYGMEFRQAKDYGVFGGSEYKDIEGAVKWLKAQPNVDARRIGAWGGSYGGYMTALALARDSADFAAGVDLHGVHDWSFEMDSWKATNDPNYDAAARAKTAFAASPMADVAKWKSPVLLMQGDDDRNVLFGQTVRLAAALRAQGVDVEEKIFPDEVHDFLLHKDWVKAYELAADFFDRKLKNKQ